MKDPLLDAQSDEFWYAEAMEDLVEVVQQLSMARTLDAVMEIVRKAARRLTGADGATFVLRDGDLCFYAEEDAISPLWKGLRFPMSACISGWAMLNRAPAVIEDIYADPRIPADAYRPTFVKSLAMVPIRTIDPVGAIGTYWAERRLPAPNQVKVLQALADTTAVAMENVKIYSELEVRVKQRTRELQSILDNVAVGIMFSVQRKIVRANAKSAELFHLSGEESMLDMPLDALVGVSGLDPARKILQEGRMLDVETKISLPDKSEFWAHVVAKPMAANEEIWMIADVSEAKARENALDELRLSAERATQFKSEFLATMSHEIRTPLTGMLGMLELLSLTRLDREQRETLDAAWDSGRGLLRIVSDILDWSKIEEGKLDLSPRPTSIQRLLKDTVNTYSRVASAKSLMLWQHADSRLKSAYIVDPLRLSQILNNLVSNAIKFTEAGEIEVRAEFLGRTNSGDRIRFSVRDTGKGISNEVQKQLFQPYRQESADTARLYGGTGLGLSICRKLADMMDGKIGLESESGQGSVFSITLTLPISGLPGETLRIAHPEVRQRDVEPLLLEPGEAPIALVVDDHPVNRDLLARQIRLLGLRAETAENGEEALSKWKEGRFSIVITDCHMPGMDGYALGRAIRKAENRQSPRTTILAWTANVHAEEAGHCSDAGMDDLLIKPASLAQLKKILKKWLKIDDQGGESRDTIDFTVLDNVAFDSASQTQVLNDFRSHMRSDREKLSKMLDGGDLAGAGNIAHRMTGSSRMVGAKQLALACSAVEQAAREKSMEGAVSGKGILDEALSQFDAFLASRAP